MRKMYLIELNYESLNREEYINGFIQYHVEELSNGSLKECLAEIDVPMTSYAYARKNGFIKSKKVLDKLIANLGISLDIIEDDYRALKDLVHGAITESYFIGGPLLKEVRDKVEDYREKARNTPLYLLYCLAFLSSYDYQDFSEEKYKEMNEEVIPFLEHVKPTLSKDMQYFYLFSVTEYYFTVNKDELTLTFIPEYEALDKDVDERLKTMGYFDLFTLYALNGNYSRSVYYLELCHDLCFKYYNTKRLQAIRQNLTAIHYRNKNYDEALNNALGDLLFLYREDPHEKKVFFKSLLVVITTSYIYLDKYQEALEYTENFFEYEIGDYYDQALLLRKFCLYKLNAKNITFEIDNVEKDLKMKDHLFTDEYYVLSNLIDMLITQNKKDMKTFGDRLKPLFKNTMSPYLKIAGLLKDEYKAYIIKANRYLDVLDMK